MENCDPDLWSRIELDDFVLTKLRLVPAEIYYYFVQHGKDMDDGLVKLERDADALQMAADGEKSGMVDVYIVARSNNPVQEVGSEGEFGPSQVTDADSGQGTPSKNPPFLKTEQPTRKVRYKVGAVKKVPPRWKILADQKKRKLRKKKGKPNQGMSDMKGDSRHQSVRNVMKMYALQLLSLSLKSIRKNY